MYMVTNTTNTNHLATRGVDQLTDIAMYAVYVFAGYLRTCDLYMEDDVQIYFAKRLWHIFVCFCPFGAFVIVLVQTPGRCPGLCGYCPFGALPDTCD